MFGYIRIDKDELKVRDYNLFKAYYCGVCQALKREYGFPARYFLSYDVTFLAVLLGALQKETPTACAGRCLANPMTKRPMLESNPVLSYVAAVNVLLVWFKLLDDWSDSHSLRAAALLPLMYRKQKKAKKKYPHLYRQIAASLDELAALEKAETPQIDPPAAAFGKLMSAIFDTELAGSSENRRIASHAGFLLGRFIYLLDAWEDKDEDKKKQSYNPFILEEIPVSDLRLSLDYTLGELAGSLQLLTFARNRDIIENIIYLGLKNIQDSVLSGQYNKKEKRHERPI